MKSAQCSTSRYDESTTRYVSPISLVRAAGLCLAAAALLSACTGGNTSSEGAGDQPNTAGGSEQQAAPEAPPAPAELVFYSTSNDSEEVFNKRFGDAIRKKFPHFTVSYIRSTGGNNHMTTMLTTGTHFDIFFHSTGNFENMMIPNKLQFDMTPLLEKHKVDMNKFEPTLVQAFKQMSEKEVYGLPVFYMNYVLMYNKTLFDRFGIAYPKDGMTWDDALELSKRIARTEEGVDYFGLSTSPLHMMRMNQFSLPFVDPKTEKPTIASDERWKTLFEKTFMVPGNEKLANSFPQVNEFARKATLAMFPYLSTLAETIPGDMKNIQWDMTALPAFKELPGVGSQLYPTYFGITQMAKNKDAAMQAIAYLTSPEVQVALSRQTLAPAIASEEARKAFGQDSEFKNINWNAVFYNKPAPMAAKSLYDSKVEAVYLREAGNPLVQGKLDINSAFRAANEAAEKVIAEEKSK